MSTPVQESKVPVTVTVTPLLAYASPDSELVVDFHTDVKAFAKNAVLLNKKDGMSRPSNKTTTFKLDIDSAVETAIQINVRYSDFLKRILASSSLAHGWAPRLSVFVGTEPSERLFQCEF